MRPIISAAFVGGCLVALIVACTGTVLFQDRQFSYRDAGEYYYPLHQRVQEEWAAGRWPLWEPEENGGMPLVGNPSAAVFYPGKILYFLLPYPWAARLYVIAHLLLAFAGTVALLRSWKVSWTGSSLGALAYAFGGPVLFQYSNVIYLVGAAWVPLGLRGVDRTVRLRKRRASLGLAVVLALQILGGDPEAAYLVFLCGGLYAATIAWQDRRQPSADSPPARTRAIWIGAGVLLAPLAWIVVSLCVAGFIRINRQWFPYRYQSPYPDWYQMLLAFGWVGIAGVIWRRWRELPTVRGMVRTWGFLAVSMALALALSAVQVLPTLECSRLSVRASADGPHDTYPFSVEPYRVVESVWPGIFGSFKHGERNWQMLVPAMYSRRTWTPSLYLGGLTLILSLSAAGLRGGPPWRIWLALVAAGSLVAAVGQYSSPIWWARELPGGEQVLGAHDPWDGEIARSDGGVADGDGSFYWLLAAVLPGFQTFRYPAKLLTFTTIALAALAGMGWDRWRAGCPRRAPTVLLVLSVVALVVVAGSRERLIQLLGEAGRNRASIFGPFDPRGALDDIRHALEQGAIVMASAALLAAAARRGSRWADAVALVVMTADLAVANADLVISVPQAMFDKVPRIAQLIQEAEKRNPSTGPFRVHRMPMWFPANFYRTNSNRRYLEVTEWEYETMKPKYGLTGGLSYTLTGGPLELNDYASFFGGFFVRLDSSRVALRAAQHGQRVLYHTRRGFDLWNTRYFIVPMDPGGWQNTSRGFASFLEGGELMAPDSSLTSRPEDPEIRALLQAWIDGQDWQLIRNEHAYPRAWVVHRARLLAPIRDKTGKDHERIMEQILYADDRFWSFPGRRVFDPRAMAWIETDDPRLLASYLPGKEPAQAEAVTIVSYEPQRVEIEASLELPGVVILADVNYPGWTLTIDGQPAEILRANRLMRGAAVPAGNHRLVYTYAPRSFNVGGLISLASMGLALIPAVLARSMRGRGDEERNA
jgi:hypothetical protein